MRHCCKFKADDIYYLYETALYTTRKLSVGFCPICEKPVAELCKIRFDGTPEREYFVGIKANTVVCDLQDEINYSMKECTYKNAKSKENNNDLS